MDEQPEAEKADIKFFEDLLEDYRLSLKALNRSQKTIDWYLEILRQFFRYLFQANMLKPVEQLGTKELEAYLLHLQERDRWPKNKYIKNKGKLSPFSIQGAVRAVKACWGWMEREGIIRKNPLAKFPLPKVPQNLIQTIAVTDMKKLLNAIDKSTPPGDRLYCILLTLIDTGARIGEVVGIKMPEVDFQNKTIVVTGKGQKQRLVPFSRDTRKALIKFRDGPRAKLSNVESDCLFPDKYGGHVSTSSVQQAVRRLAHKVGLVKCHPHLFRHTFASTFIAKGGAAPVLKEIMGHESFQTTEKYIHPKTEDLKMQHQLYSPVTEIFKQE
jgi:site-specific recombinase XerD